MGPWRKGLLLCTGTIGRVLSGKDSTQLRLQLKKGESLRGCSLLESKLLQHRKVAANSLKWYKMFISRWQLTWQLIQMALSLKAWKILEWGGHVFFSIILERNWSQATCGSAGAPLRRPCQTITWNCESEAWFQWQLQDVGDVRIATEIWIQGIESAKKRDVCYILHQSYRTETSNPFQTKALDKDTEIQEPVVSLKGFTFALI